jgi:glutamate-1-semialdehyde 2,1-aminomutase
MIKFEDLYAATDAKLPLSNKLLERAKKVLLSQFVTGPYRAPANVTFIKRGQGSKVWDVDGNEYLDMTMGYGPLILGHAPPLVVTTTQEAVVNGTNYAIANEHEVRMAELMTEAIPCAQRIAFCNSGTEATMHAIKIARAGTGKTKIATFEGGYHGVHDYAQVGSPMSSGSGPANAPIATSDTAGIPDSVTDSVVKLAFDCDESLERIRELKDELAVVIIEPVPSSYPVNMQEFLTRLRAVTKECGVLLMFDEVISGFRCGYRGAQDKYDVVPDLATYGKIIGGGFPVGAVTGTDEAMAPIISTGDIFQDLADRKVFAIGTFSGNPITMQVGAAVLEHLRDNPDIYTNMDRMTTEVKDELNTFAKENNLPFELIGENSWFMPFLGDKKFSHSRDNHDDTHAIRNIIFCNYMRYEGIYFPDMHIVFFSDAHTQEDANLFVEISKKTLINMRDQGLFS